MRASTSRACGSVCSVGTAAPPTNSPRSSPASTTARTRFTPCTGARSEPTRSEWSRRCAITTISTRSSTTRSWSGGNSCRGARGDPAMSLNPVDRSLLRLLLYYVLLVAGTIVLARYVPAVRRALALAFSLAGLAAAVRFRNTLKDTKDAVYIFVAMGVGIAAGVQALALCFVMSVIYNVSVVTLWALNVGDTYPGEPRPSFTGEFQIATALPAIHDILLVDADPAAQPLVERMLERLTKSWRLIEQGSGTDGRTTFTYEVRLKKKTTRAALIDAIAREAAPHVATATFQA